MRSNDALRPRSAFSDCGITSRDSPAASVSSVSGVGAKNPVPKDSRLDQPPALRSAETRGLKKVPNSLCASTVRSPTATATRHVHIVLREDAGHDVGVREAREILRTKRVALDRRTGHPGVPAPGAPDRDLAEGGVVSIALADRRRTDEAGCACANDALAVTT